MNAPARVVHELRLFFVALQFMTRAPVPRWVGFAPGWLNQSARHFPAVGLCVGAVAALVLAGADAAFGRAVAVVVSMLATVWLTGAFHEDGLADTCDALGGAVSRERALAIMKDSRIGAYGAVGLVLALGLKAAALVSMPLAWALPALLIGHCTSRAAAVALIRWLPYAGDVEHAKAKPLAQRIGGVGLAVAWGRPIVVAVTIALVAPHQAGAAGLSLALAAAGALWGARWLRRRLGGYTGDTLGATQQVTELLILLGWVAMARLARWA